MVSLVDHRTLVTLASGGRIEVPLQLEAPFRTTYESLTGYKPNAMVYCMILHHQRWATVQPSPNSGWALCAAAVLTGK